MKWVIISLAIFSSFVLGLKAMNWAIPDCPEPVVDTVLVVHDPPNLYHWQESWEDSIAVLNEQIALWRVMKPDDCYGMISIAVVEKWVRKRINIYPCSNDSLSWFARFNGHEWQQFLDSLKQAKGL